MNTKDPQDRPILPGKTRIVWAYGTTDQFSYHELHRGFTGIFFLQYFALTPRTAVVFYGKGPDPMPSGPEYHTIDFLNGNATVPTEVTTYLHIVHKIPEFPTDKHIVAFEAVIQPAIGYNVHHFILYSKK